jgi:beta-galactosidase/beta-glucuronidase
VPNFKHILLLPLFSGFFHAFSQYEYIENPQVFEENKLDARASFVFDQQKNVREINHNPHYFFLNGEWLFHHSLTPEQRPANFHQTGFDYSNWNKIPVPGNWQLYGYDYPIYTNWKYPFHPDKPNVPRDFNPVGSYIKEFTLPENWTGNTGEIILHFGGVNSCFFVWLNGKYVGYSEDSKLPSEFNITPHLQQGKNILSVEVYRYCDGTYLEDQDMWRVSGIERDVYLIKTPEISINDFKIRATPDHSLKNGTFSGHIKLNNPQGKAFIFSTEFFDNKNKLLWSDSIKSNQYTQNAHQTFNLFAAIENIELWSPEKPTLYTVRFSIMTADGHTLQVVEQPIGFKKVEIRNGIFYINDEIAEIRGVNRHEHDPRFGHAVGYSDMAFNKKDMTEDLMMIKSLGMNAVRTAHYPNHPMFYALCDSLGLYVCDEANIEAHWYMMFRPFRNITRDPDFRNAILSRIRNMYERDKNFTSIIMWSVGNENGTGPTMVEAYEMLKRLDPEIPVFNERHFFLNLIRKKHSDFNGHMYAPISKVKKLVKKVSDKPFIWIEYAHAMGNSTGNFKDLWDFIRSEERVQGGFIWDWRDQGLWTTNEHGEKFLGYGGHFEPEGVHHDGNFCANGLISADGQLKPGALEVKFIHENQTRPSDIPFAAQTPGATNKTGKLKIENRDGNIAVTGNGFEYLFSSSGKLISLTANGKPLISDFGLNFWRAPTDNDFGNGMHKKAAQWRMITEKQPFSGITDTKNHEDEFVLKAQFDLPKKKKATIQYTINASGALTTDIEMNLISKTDIPRIGSYWILSENQNEFSYLGNGPHENYADRFQSAWQQRNHILNANKQPIPYIRPQEYGNRTGVYYAESSDIKFFAEKAFNFSAWNHSLWDIDETIDKQKGLNIGNFKKGGKIPLDVPQRDYIWVNVDYAQRGLGGDNSWGRLPYDKYLLKKGKYRYSYTMLPKLN